jgi:hypothetical protein
MTRRDKIVFLVDWFILPVYIVAFIVFILVGALLLTLALIPSICKVTKSIIFGGDFSWSNVDSYSNQKINNLFAWWFCKQHEIISVILGKKPIDQLRRFEKNDSRSLVKLDSVNKIYCFKGPWFDKAFGNFIIAISSDGEVLARCSARSKEEAQERIGYVGNYHHVKYRNKFPKGYSMEWVNNVSEHEGFLDAYRMYEFRVKNNKNRVKYHTGLSRSEIKKELKDLET